MYSYDKLRSTHISEHKCKEFVTRNSIHILKLKARSRTPRNGKWKRSLYFLIQIPSQDFPDSGSNGLSVFHW